MSRPHVVWFNHNLCYCNVSLCYDKQWPIQDRPMQLSTSKSLAFAWALLVLGGLLQQHVPVKINMYNKTFSEPHTRTTTWSMNIVYIYILLSLPRCLMCPLLSGTMPKTSWFIAADSKTPADDDGLMTPKRCVHHHLPCTVRGLFSFYTFQKSWN